MNYFITKLLFSQEKILYFFLIKYFFQVVQKECLILIFFNNFDDKIKYLIFLVINF